MKCILRNRRRKKNLTQEQQQQQMILLAFLMYILFDDRDFFCLRCWCEDKRIFDESD